MSLTIIQGDLFDPSHEFDALAQGVNTQGIMGGGIALPFAKKWPAMKEDYIDRCEQFGDALSGLLHIWRGEPVMGEPFINDDGCMEVEVEFEPTIYNLFSQRMPGRDGNLAFLRSAAILTLLDAEENEYAKVGLPWIGCGIAGLERHNVHHILANVFEDSAVDFVIVQQDPIHEPLTEEELASIDGRSISLGF